MYSLYVENLVRSALIVASLSLYYRLKAFHFYDFNDPETVDYCTTKENALFVKLYFAKNSLREKKENL